MTFMRFVSQFIHRSKSLSTYHLVRYLSKITDQLVALISNDHSRSIVWNDQKQESHVDAEGDETDRLYTFHVTKTNEQEESVTIRPGFKVDHS